MYRVNSVSRTITKLLVVEHGRETLVTLLPKNFVFSEKVTDQMKVLEKNGVIRVRKVPSLRHSVAKVQPKVDKKPELPAKPHVQEQPKLEGKLDFIQSKTGKKKRR